MKSGTSADPDMPTRPSATTTYVLDMTQPSPAWQETAPMACPADLPHPHSPAGWHRLGYRWWDHDGRYRCKRSRWARRALVSGHSNVDHAVRPLGTPPLPLDRHADARRARVRRRHWQRPGRRAAARMNAMRRSSRRRTCSKGRGRPSPRQPFVVQYGSNLSQVSTPDVSRIAGVSLIKLASVTHAFNADHPALPSAVVHFRGRGPQCADCRAARMWHLLATTCCSSSIRAVSRPQRRS